MALSIAQMKLKRILQAAGKTTLADAKAFLEEEVKLPKPFKARLLQKRSILGLVGATRGTEIMIGLRTIAASNNPLAPVIKELVSLIDNVGEGSGVDMAVDDVPTLVAALTGPLSLTVEEQNKLLNFAYLLAPRWRIQGFASMFEDSEIAEVLS